MGPRSKPLLIYDGDCGFCLKWVQRWRGLTGERIDYAPYQEVQAQFPQILKEQFESAVQLVEPSGEIFRGARAVFRMFTHVRWLAWVYWLYRYLPGAAFCAERTYQFVARHRHEFSVGTQCRTGIDPGTPTYFLATDFFLRVLGVIYGIAFVSLWMQVDGLIGQHGILPVQEFLKGITQPLGPERYREFPTLCWLASSDRFLHLICGAGVVFSILLAMGLVPIVCLFGLWGMYLSLTVGAQDFLSFQWDILLLEAGFLAIFLSPWCWRLKGNWTPPPLVRWLFVWLLFRLIFSSGFVKIASGDPAWRNLTALTFHYETQPLPTWIGWYAHQCPVWFQKASVLGMFAIELVVPFLFFGGRRPRLVGAGVTVFFQLLILLTGNYCFFNLLTIALCLFLVEDASWPPIFQRRLSGFKEEAESMPLVGWPRWVLLPIAFLLVLATTVQMGWTLRLKVPWPRPALELVGSLLPFRSTNNYGLFAVMTTWRPEIVVEGSEDGVTWKAYEFRYKPGDLERRPQFVEPHQPRLDWQMWFASLGPYQRSPWFLSFCVRLLQGSPQVLRLLAKNPFPDGPPRYIRAFLYDYHFTDVPARRTTGLWWRRELKGSYCPALSLRQPENRQPS